MTVELTTKKTRLSKKFYQEHPHLLEVMHLIEQDRREKLTSVILNELPPNHWAISDIYPSEHHRYYLVSSNGDIAIGRTLVHFSEGALSLALYDYQKGEEVAYLYKGKGQPELNANKFAVGEGCYFIDQSLHTVRVYKVDSKFALNAA